LDPQRGGAFSIHPEQLIESRQFYEEDSGVLTTEIRTRSGLVRLTDVLTIRGGSNLREDAAAGRGELLRKIVAVDGQVRLCITLAPRGGARSEPRAGGLQVRAAAQPDLDLQLSSTMPLDGLRTTITLVAGGVLYMTLSWGGGRRRHEARHLDESLQATLDGWRTWVRHITYDGPQSWLVRRSAITLKLLDHFQNGAIVAAPTSSLPEAIGGSRNWDYRYSWIRDAAFSVYALNRIGLTDEAAGFLGWALDAFEQSDRPRALYDLDGRVPPQEREDPDLAGYLDSTPVRWGNAAAEQHQHDVYGEILDCAFQWAAHHGNIDEALWGRLQTLIDAARDLWHQPDHGIWEIRTTGRVFTYSAAMCQVALDRGARMAQRFQLRGDVKGWLEAAEQIRKAILEGAWDERSAALTQALGWGGLDASLLALPLRRVIAANHPRMVATTAAIQARLGVGNGLLHRYIPEESPDGVPGHEGAFLLCSFWLVDNLAHQGRLEAASNLYDSLCERAGPLGLLPEQVEPTTGAFLGNYPQALSHVGVISSGVNLARKLHQMRSRPRSDIVTN
jgi:GH15 family glucan-1,4-alpha-glucosidase